jgi:autophagy-related protein 9
MNSIFSKADYSLNINLSVDEFQEFYLKKTFLNKLYFYYVNHGYTNIISTELVNIFTSSFLIFYTIFLYNCVNWSELLSLNTKTNFSQLVDISHFFKLNGFYWILFCIFIFVVICKIINLSSYIQDYKSIKNFYNNKLKINDKDLSSIKWKDIIETFNKVYNNEDINVYYINNKICCKSNYLITLLDKDILKMSYMNQIMEWNLIFCIINSIFDEDMKFNTKFLSLDKKFIEIIRQKLLFVTFINFIFMPFIITYLFFYYLFKYGEKFYSNPQYLFSRNWTLLAKWKMRNYNELYHEFREKFIKSQKICNEYSSLFPNRIIQTFSKFFLFVLSSIFVVLIFSSILNEHILLHLYIFSNKQVLWFIGIVGSLIAILKNINKEKEHCYPKEKMIELNQVINCIPEYWLEKETDTKTLNKDFFNLYQLQIIIIFKDIFYTLFIPFKLFKLSFNIKNIIMYLENITTNNPK